jgi:Tfp pilus assembly protein PilE
MKRVLLCAVLLVGCNAMDQYKCRARQSEAKSTLGAIKVAEASYFAEHKSYTASLTDLAIAVQPKFYSLELSITGGGKGYKAIAKGDKPETTGDEWTVTEAGDATAVTDKCAH